MLTFYQQTNRIQSQITYLQHFLPPSRPYVHKKPLYRQYTCLYVWLFDRTCGISFIYNKNNNGPIIYPCGTPQFTVPGSEKTFSNDTKKAV